MYYRSLHCSQEEQTCWGKQVKERSN